MMGSYYEIVTNGCKKGWAFVRDYMGNKCFYGQLEECYQFINDMMGYEVCRYEKQIFEV